MEIRFTKLDGNRHEIVVRGRRGAPDIRRPPRETGPTIPHDLAHAAVERALGLTDGFWSAVEKGVMFEDFELVERGRHRRAGLKAYRKLADATFPAEMVVSWAHRAWSGQRTSGRGLGAPPIGEAELERAFAALDEAHAQWVALPVGETLVVHW